MAKIFVRTRQRVGRGEKRPRFLVVAVEGLDLKVYARHLRRKELEALSAAVGAELVFLPGSEGADQEPHGKGPGRQRHRHSEDEE